MDWTNQKQLMLDSSNSRKPHCSQDHLSLDLQWNAHSWGELFSLEKCYAEAMFLFNLVPEFSTAQWRLGMVYRDAEGVEQDLVKAVSFFEKAANQGDPRGICDLGMCYGLGIGVDKDVKKAMALFRHGADQGHMSSVFNPAVIFMNGDDGVEKDEEQAIALLNQAADLGYISSLRQLGQIYRRIPEYRDPFKAVAYFLRGAEKDDREAALYLGEMYLDGEGIERNVDQALHFFEMAANLGLAKAQRILGFMHVQGKGLPITKRLPSFSNQLQIRGTLLRAIFWG